MISHCLYPNFMKKHAFLPILLVKLRHLLHSNTWQTTWMVMAMVVVNVCVTLWFFWRSLYLPEIKSHAQYLANELLLMEKIRHTDDWQLNDSQQQHILSSMHLTYVDNVMDFPDVTEKPVVSYFTEVMESEIAAQIDRPVQVYFKFKPTSMLWIQDSRYPKYWMRESVVYYSQYSPTLMLTFVLGIPILALVTILLLVRQLNRPLRRLQRVANNYIQLGQATTLPTAKGSSEIRQVNMAFNRLFTTLSQTQKERNIMLAGISHDLRTPLTRMRLTAEMLPDEFLKEGLVYDIEDMDAILEQFISFMKDGSDEPVRLTDLSAIINEIIVQFAPLDIRHHSYHGNHHDNEPLPLVALRPLSIKRLMINLVNNATRYGTPPIEINVHIVHRDVHLADALSEVMNAKPTSTLITDVADTHHMAMNKHDDHHSYDTLIICVRDHGEGVADDQLARIMQPFERGETARTTQGSGLGLAIVTRIAKLHHGQVLAQNHHDGGLMVCVVIPLLSQGVVLSQKAENTINTMK